MGHKEVGSITGFDGLPPFGQFDFPWFSPVWILTLILLEEAFSFHFPILHWQSWDLTAGPIFVQAIYPYPHSASPLYQEIPIHFHAGIFKRWYSSDSVVKASWNNTAAEVSQVGWQAWLHCSWLLEEVVGWDSWISDATSTPTDLNVICLYQILLLKCRYPWRVNSNGQSPLQMVICMHTNMRF